MKVRLLLIALSLTAFAAWSQSGKNSLSGLPLSERIYFGGGGGFSSGTSSGYRYTAISINPLVGYRITMPWSAGVGVNYQYYRYPDINTSINQYGFSPFTMYRLGASFFLYGEYQVISSPTYDNSARATYTRLPVGLGYTAPIGRRAALNVMALYDLKYDRQTTVFSSPWILRIFVTAGGISLY